MLLYFFIVISKQKCQKPLAYFYKLFISVVVLYVMCFFVMKNSLLFIVLFAFWIVFLTGCSMMPDDEEIIKWSILENEIFWEEFLDEVSNDENLNDDEIENVENDDELVENDEDNEEDNEEWNTKIQVEVAD